MNCTGIGIHQLRHAHASELINSGVSIEVVRRRLGHASTETTQIYTLLADKVADTEAQVVRRVLLRRNIVIDPETAQLVAAAVQAALQAGASSRPPGRGPRVSAAGCEPLF